MSRNIREPPQMKTYSHDSEKEDLNKLIPVDMITLSGKTQEASTLHEEQQAPKK